MTTDIVLQENSVEVAGTLNAKNGITTTSLRGRRLILRDGPFQHGSLQLSALAFHADRYGKLLLGTRSHGGQLFVRGYESTSMLTSERCEAEEIIGNKYVAAGKPSNPQESPRRGIDGRLSVNSAESEEAQVEIIGRTGDIRIAGSIKPIEESPIMFMYEHGIEFIGTSEDPDSSQSDDPKTDLDSVLDIDSEFDTDAFSDSFDPSRLRQLPLGGAPTRRTIIAHSPNFKDWGMSYDDSKKSFDFHDDEKVILQVNLSNKRVGVGTDEPTHDFHVNGTIAAREFIDSLSDSRCKDIHGEIEDALTKIQNLRGVRFRWKTDSSPLKTEDREHLGVVAQEVEKVLPEVVSFDDNGIASVAYSGIIPVLIEALKDEARERQNLEKRLKKVEDLVQKLLDPVVTNHQTSKA